MAAGSVGGGLGLIGGAVGGAELQHAHLAAAAAAHAHHAHASTSHFSLQHEQLREENQRLLTQIVDVQKNFQVMTGCQFMSDTSFL